MDKYELGAAEMQSECKTTGCLKKFLKSSSVILLKRMGKIEKAYQERRGYDSEPTK